MSLLLAAAPVSTTPLWVVVGYLGLLVALGLVVATLFRGTSSDYFVASRSIGSFLLLMSVFGTTMTAFALVGSTGKAYELGAGVYGLMASSSGLVHSLVFFVVGIRLWAIGKRHDFVTQIQFFRARYDSNALGYLLFPILVGLVIPYLLIGLLGAGATVRAVTGGMFPEMFPGVTLPSGQVRFAGAVPPWITSLAVCAVVLFYITLGGLRGAAWANAMQTIVFMITGVIAFYLIAKALGGPVEASRKVLEVAPDHVTRTNKIGHLQFLSYGLVPLSVGMFPHLFQHWLTAKSAKTFRLTVVAHPLFIMIVWVPCILIGIWAVGQGIQAPGGNPNAVLGRVVGGVLHQPFMTGLLTAGILAAIMSSLDSQFVCLGTMFTHDIVIHATGRDRFTDKQKILLGRGFIVVIVAVTYLLSLLEPPKIFDLAVWCFSGFSALFPVVFAAIYWRRATRVGAFASVLTTVVVWSVFFYNGLLNAPEDLHGDYLVGGMMPVAWMVLASTVAMIVGSLASQPPAREVVDRFFLRGEQTA